MRVLSGGIAGALLLLSLPAAADDDLQVNRAESPTAVTRGTAISTPSVRTALVAGDLLRTGPGGHLSVQLAGGGTFTLGENSSAQIVSTRPPDPPGRTVLLQLQLDQGAVRVDARKQDQRPPADVRLALPKLKARLYGTDAWAEVSPAGEELCVMSGAAEIDTPDGHRRLDEAGECLRATASGVERIAAREVGSLLPRLALTAFTDDHAARYAALQAQRDGSARPRLAESAVAASASSRYDVLNLGTAPASAAAPTAPASTAPPPAPAAASTAAQKPATPAATISGPSEWRLVLGGLPSRAQAEARAATLNARGWKIDVVEANTAGGRVFRLLAGHYPTRAAASTAQAKTHKIADLKDAWIIEVPLPRP